MLDYPFIYVDGRWQQPAGTGRIEVRSASTEEPIGAVAAGTAADVGRAVDAAGRAQAGWGETPPTERADWLAKLADGLEAAQSRIASLISQEVGTPIKISTAIQAGQPVAIARYYAGLTRRWRFESEVGHSLVVREPWGVVGAITPWNYPLHQIFAKVAPALGAGCTVVLKPSELAPLNACVLADVCQEIGLPPGVLNIVHGTGPEVGEALVNHPGVDMVSFTGSVRTGRRILTLAAESIKKVTLELGGKSACVVLDDAPFEKAVPAGVKNALLNSGQTCSAWTRMVVPRARVDQVVELARKTIATLPLGDPLDPATRLGPLISEPQRDRVEGYIAKGRAEGATVATGGGRPAHLPRGHYVEPTVFADVTPRMTIAQEEIFGPVLAVLAYETEAEAIAIANGTIYGLAGAVWSADEDRALAVARKIRAGQVDINGARYNLEAPFGGYKQSGLGREFGEAGLEEFLQHKALAR
jgi:betaine-aldehyde dehydrogenase